MSFDGYGGSNDNHPLTNGTYDDEPLASGGNFDSNPVDPPLRTDFGPDGPQPGTAAYTAFIMAQLYPDEPDGFWDDWKDDMKEGRL